MRKAIEKHAFRLSDAADGLIRPLQALPTPKVVREVRLQNVCSVRSWASLQQLRLALDIDLMAVRRDSNPGRSPPSTVFGTARFTTLAPSPGYSFSYRIRAATQAACLNKKPRAGHPRRELLGSLGISR